MEIKVNFEGCFGCEIEGLILEREFEKLKDITLKNNKRGWALGGDGSIRCDNPDYCGFELKAGVYKFTELNILIEDLKPVFDLIKVNASCGLHMHVSFKDILNYYKLLNWGFVDNFQKNYLNKFKNNLEQNRSSNYYSKFVNDEISFNNIIEQQLKDAYKDNSRYHAVNFNAFNLYKTIEFRIFPATSHLNKFVEYLNFLFEEIKKGLEFETDFNKYDIVISETKKRNGPQSFKEIIKVEVEIKK